MSVPIRYVRVMSDLILQAIDKAVPGLTEGDRRVERPTWVGNMLEATEVWLGGFAISDVEVAVVRRDENFDLEKLIVSVLTRDGVAAQAIITIDQDREDGWGQFAGWKIVRLGRISSLAWSRHKAGPDYVNQLTATFRGLTEPIVIPAEISYGANPDRFTEAFRILRDAWIDSGAADRIAEEPNPK